MAVYSPISFSTRANTRTQSEPHQYASTLCCVKSRRSTQIIECKPDMWKTYGYTAEQLHFQFFFRVLLLLCCDVDPAPCRLMQWALSGIQLDFLPF